MIELLSNPETYVSLLTLSAMEIVLGIDNIIFISILTGALPKEQRERARKLGLLGALVTRLGFLFTISWMMGLTKPLFSIGSLDFSGQSLILLAGGLFLLYKSTTEIHEKLEGEEEAAGLGRKGATFWGVISQVIVLDVVFSIDSVVTAVGMSPHLTIMVAANVIALALMLAVGGRLGAFVEKHPTIKMLALAFLLMIGVMLCAEGLGFHIPKGYIYFAMGFSVLVELLNQWARKKRKSEPVALRQTPSAAEAERAEQGATAPSSPPAAPPPAL